MLSCICYIRYIRYIRSRARCNDSSKVVQSTHAMAFALFVTTSAFLLGPSTPPLMSTARRPLIAVVMDEQQQQQKRTDIDVTAAKTSLLDKLKGGGDRLASMLRRGGEKEALTSRKSG